METFNFIDVEIDSSFKEICEPSRVDINIAKDKHPLPKPIKPFNEGNNKKYAEELVKYEDQLKKYNDIDKTLRRYIVSFLKCESGMLFPGQYVGFKIGAVRKAQLLEDGTVIIDTFKYK